MRYLFAGMLDGALYGAIAGGCIGLVMGLILLLMPKRKCPQCEAPLPNTLAGPVRKCPKCGCEMNAKGEKVGEKTPE
jgi:hypothetical protein